jgi:hypothetical protein
MPVKMVGLGIISSYNSQRYESNDQAFDNLSCIKTDKKCKLLSNFPDITLCALVINDIITVLTFYILLSQCSAG